MGSLKGYWNLISQLHDREFVAQHANQAAFIDSLEAYPGGALRDWFASIWLENETAHGHFKVGKAVANFKDITCPVLGIAGKSDNLANVACCKPITKGCWLGEVRILYRPGRPHWHHERQGIAQYHLGENRELAE